MKRKIKTTQHPKTTPEPLILKESVVVEGVGLTMPVPAAKARLSALLELVASGTQVTITSDGQPKAGLRPVEAAREELGFEPAWDLLESVSTQTEGPFSEELIRADRDGRGW